MPLLKTGRPSGCEVIDNGGWLELEGRDGGYLLAKGGRSLSSISRHVDKSCSRSLRWLLVFGVNRSDEVFSLVSDLWKNRKGLASTV